MKRTIEEVGSLINYDKINQIKVLAPPTLAKEDIPGIITCQNFEKAKRKIEQTMERYNQKVGVQKQKVAELEEQIAHLTKEIKKRTEGSFLGDMMGSTLSGAKPGMFDSAEKHNEKAQKYNAILEVVRRLEDQRQKVIDKHTDAVEKHNEAIEEANEKLEGLTSEAMAVIDDDIVAVLDKCTKVSERLSNTPNSQDWLAALEVAFIELKLYHVLEGHIDGNTQRKECKERVGEIHGLFGRLCVSEHAANHLADLFRRNIYLITKNAELCGQVRNVLAGVDQKVLDAQVSSLGQILGENFVTQFDYEGTVDPSAVDAIINKMKDSIASIRRNIAKATEFAASTKPLAEAATNADQGARAFFGTMKSNLEGMSTELLTPGHFACEMVNEAVIDDFYHRDLRPGVVALRQQLVAAIKEEHLDALLAADQDRYSIAKAEAAIQQAKLARLQTERVKIDGHVRKLTGAIAELESHIGKADNVPQANADAFRADSSTKYMLACIPFIGVFIAFGILGKIKSFEAAFKSTNRIYRDLATEVLAKNAQMMTVSLVLAGVVGVGGMIVFFALHVGADATVNAGVPGVALAAYLGTWALMSQAGKQLQSFMEASTQSASRRSEAVAR
jgi:septal ring factor EnvC (AmiA/AmiB activator)